MSVAISSKVQPLRFTFQSGSIQIELFKAISSSFSFLHSNLVLFKWNGGRINRYVCNLYIPIWFYSNDVDGKSYYLTQSFTFQSGSIQMDVGGYTVEGFNHFTFQSGSIQIIRIPHWKE